MLERLNKNITLEQIRETIRATRKHGIRALGFFLDSTVLILRRRFTRQAQNIHKQRNMTVVQGHSRVDR